ncbi:hypothetical protein [uncultured Alistipes sp.]|jgi:hypothetical protein|uniref:hypothetical protein n=1 Tax=uncultured Alistipes sp. TaxID=538949 RepID=UPI0025E9ADD2|nr:hypothetical protein [uncultured Alistipes sp.]
MKTRNKFYFGLPIFLAVFAAGAAVVMLLWNWLIPSIIGWSAIGYWQAVGLLLLCKLLFGGFGKGGHWFGHHRGHCHSHMGAMHREREQMRDHMHQMNREERKEYIRRHMFGCRPTERDHDGE